MRRRWLDSSIRVDQPLLASPVYPRDIQPDAVEVYGSLAAGGAEDTEKVAKHLKAWDTLLSNVKKGKGKPKVGHNLLFLESVDQEFESFFRTFFFFNGSHGNTTHIRIAFIVCKYSITNRWRLRRRRMRI